jgi:enoyl-CoA hydratase/carnithine racemase
MPDGIVYQGDERGLHRVVLDRGPNALDPPMMAALSTTLKDLRMAGSPPVVIASAHPSLFCPGWDLKLLADADRDEVGGFLATFNDLVRELFSYPGPTAAEIGGHAVAGGCLLAACCDLRIMASGPPRLGLSELNLGVPVPGVSLRMLAARFNPTAVDELVFRSEGCTAERARDLGVVHRAVAAGELSSATHVELGRLAGRSRRAFVETKRLLFSEVWETMAAAPTDEDAAFLDCWFEHDTRARISEVAGRLKA